MDQAAAGEGSKGSAGEVGGATRPTWREWQAPLVFMSVVVPLPLNSVQRAGVEPTSTVTAPRGAVHFVLLNTREPELRMRSGIYIESWQRGHLNTSKNRLVALTRAQDSPCEAVLTGGRCGMY
jgi:hypothetical protein